MKYKNENGEEFEAFSQEELDAKAKELADAAAAKAVEDYKTANPAKTTEQVAAEKVAKDAADAAANEPIARMAKELAEVKAKLTNAEVAGLARTYAGADATKQAEFKTMFGRLSGYEETSDGMAERAKAAALAVGIDIKGVDISGVSSTGSGRNVDNANAPKATEADAVVQKVLGISAEDVKKFGASAQEVTKP